YRWVQLTSRNCLSELIFLNELRASYSRATSRFSLALPFSDIVIVELSQITLDLDLGAVVCHEVRGADCILPICRCDNLTYQVFETTRILIAFARHTDY